MATQLITYAITYFVNMAPSIKSQNAIEKAKLSEVPVPWCEEYSKMVSGMK